MPKDNSSDATQASALSKCTCNPPESIYCKVCYPDDSYTEHPRAAAERFAEDFMVKWPNCNVPKRHIVGWFHTFACEILDSRPGVSPANEPPCPECGNEQRDHRGLLKCECPAPAPALSLTGLREPEEPVSTSEPRT